MADILEQEQVDIASRLDGDSFFADITVLSERKGVVEDDINVALSVLNEKVGKIGACVVILMPVLRQGDPDSAGPEYKIRQTIQVITQPLFNDGDTGTGKSTEAIATAVRTLLHMFCTGFGGTYTFAGMEPLGVDPGKVSYGVYFERRASDSRRQKAATPLIDATDDDPLTVEITSSLADEIRYTIDGSYPTQADGILYSAPFEADLGVTIRAVAYKADYAPSNVESGAFGETTTGGREFSMEYSNEFN